MNQDKYDVSHKFRQILIYDEFVGPVPNNCVSPHYSYLTIPYLVTRDKTNKGQLFSTVNKNLARVSRH